MACPTATRAEADLRQMPVAQASVVIIPRGSKVVACASRVMISRSGSSPAVIDTSPFRAFSA